MNPITPKRRRQLLDPGSIKAWAGAFTRRNEAPIPLEQLIERYLDDTNANSLRGCSGATEQLQRGMAQALEALWGGVSNDNHRVDGVTLLDPVRKGGKKVFTIPSATVLNTGSGFIHKELCEAGTLTAGSACVFSCVYCSVGASMFQSPQTRIIRVLGIEHGEAVIRRLDPVGILRDQLCNADESPRYAGDSRKTVFISPIVDPLPSIDFLEETLELVRLVLELTPWDIRVLTKSTLVKKLAERIPEAHQDRLIYGLSIGTLNDSMARAIERLTSAPSKRLAVHRELRARGLRTYSMHCPILPQRDYSSYAEELSASADWEKDEHVWAEAMNRRGSSFQNTINALREGFPDDARLFEEITSSHDAWELDYNRPLFHALANACPPGKLRYLVYASDKDRDYWLSQRDRGAVVLGKEPSYE